MIYLIKVDAARGMARFYSLDIQPNLFGEWELVREWGRRGQSGQVRRDFYPGQGEAEAALANALRRRRRRGYAEPLQNGMAIEPSQQVD